MHHCDPFPGRLHRNNFVSTQKGIVPSRRTNPLPGLTRIATPSDLSVWSVAPKSPRPPQHMRAVASIGPLECAETPVATVRLKQSFLLYCRVRVCFINWLRIRARAGFGRRQQTHNPSQGLPSAHRKSSAAPAVTSESGRQYRKQE